MKWQDTLAVVAVAAAVLTVAACAASLTAEKLEAAVEAQAPVHLEPKP